MALPQNSLTDNFGILVLLSLPIFDQWGTLLAFILWRIKSKSNPKMSCPYNEEILTWQNHFLKVPPNTCTSLSYQSTLFKFEEISHRRYMYYKKLTTMTSGSNLWILAKRNPIKALSLGSISTLNFFPFKYWKKIV